MEYIAQWEREDDGSELICGNGMAHFGIALIQIGPIVDRFQSPELIKTGCLRLAHNRSEPLFNHNQVEIIEKELDTLIGLDLTIEERKDCLEFKALLIKIPKGQREGLRVRVCPKIFYDCE